MEPKKLFGASPEGNIFATDGSGSVTDPGAAIFPILKQTGDGNYHFIGTGFFITNNGLFATAKHVLMDVIDANRLQTHPIIMVHFINGIYWIRQILRCTSHPIADISVGVVAPMIHKKTGEPLKNKTLCLVPNIPDIGKQVCTYAYPKTVIEHGENQELHFYADFYEGLIQENYPNGRDRVMLPGPCAQTNMYIHGGASGGPVFDRSGNVFAVNSTGYDDSDLSFVTPIHTIEDFLLEDVVIPGNDTGKVRIRELIEGGFITYEERAGEIDKCRD